MTDRPEQAMTELDLYYHRLGQIVANLAYASVSMGHEAPSFSFAYIDPDEDDEAAVLVRNMFVATSQPTMPLVAEWLFTTPAGRDTRERCEEALTEQLESVTS